MHEGVARVCFEEFRSQESNQGIGDVKTSINLDGQQCAKVTISVEVGSNKARAHGSECSDLMVLEVPDYSRLFHDAGLCLILSKQEANFDNDEIYLVSSHPFI